MPNALFHCENGNLFQIGYADFAVLIHNDWYSVNSGISDTMWNGKSASSKQWYNIVWMKNAISL